MLKHSPQQQDVVQNATLVATSTASDLQYSLCEYHNMDTLFASLALP